MPSLEKYVQTLSRLKAENFFGFVLGHQGLSQDQIEEIETVLQQKDNIKIIQVYEARFATLIGSGLAKSFLAGRMAFYSLMKVLNIGAGDEVILPAFTCAVMPNAVWKAGARPVFADIDPSTLGSDAKAIEKLITKKTKMIVAQHSFGVPCAIEDIVTLGARYGIFVLEDAAIAFGSSRDGVKLGDWADAGIFSTDHTKPVNTMLGGVFYTKNKDLFKKISDFSKDLESLNKDHQARIFAQMLFEKKHFGPKQLGRAAFFKIMQRMKLKDKKQRAVFLENDYNQNQVTDSGYPYPGRMPAFLAQLGLFELDRWEDEKLKRQEILRDYIQMAGRFGLAKYLPSGYTDKRNDVVPLRLAFSYPGAFEMKKQLKKFLDVDQFWFQSTVICCPLGAESLGYIPGSCPQAEAISAAIINWPCVVPQGDQKNLLALLEKVCQTIPIR